jgi:hypothetical protein
MVQNGRSWITFDNIDFDCSVSLVFCGGTQGSTVGLKWYNSIFHDSTTTASSGSSCFITQAGLSSSNSLTEVVNNQMFNCGNIASSNPGHGIYFGKCVDCIIERNYVHDTIGLGIQATNANESGANSMVRLKIRFNFILQHGKTGILLQDNDSSEVYGNILKDGTITPGSTGDGITVSGTTNSGRNLNIKVYNNTIYNNQNFCIGVHSDFGSGHVIRNNACVNNENNSIDESGGSHTVSNNHFGTDATVFVDVSQNRFTPSEGSSLLAQGTRTGLPNGYQCIAPGNTCDIGAFQTIRFSTGTVENGDAGTFRYNFSVPTQAIRGGVGLKSCTTQHFNVTIDTGGGDVGQTESNCALSQTARVSIGIAGTVAAGNTIKGSYTRPGAAGTQLTGNECIGGEVFGCLDSDILSFALQTFQNNVAGGGAAVLTTINFRWFHLDGTLASPKWRGPEDKATAASVMRGGYTALTFGVDCTGGNCDPAGFEIWANHNGGSYARMTDTTASGPPTLPPQNPNPLTLTYGEANESCTTTGTVLTTADGWEAALENSTGGTFLLRNTSGATFTVAGNPWIIGEGTSGNPTILKPYNCEAIEIVGEIEIGANVEVRGFEHNCSSGAACALFRPTVLNGTVWATGSKYENNTVTASGTGSRSTVKFAGDVDGAILRGNAIVHNVTGGLGQMAVYIRNNVGSGGRKAKNLLITRNKISQTATDAEDNLQIGNAAAADPGDIDGVNEVSYNWFPQCLSENCIDDKGSAAGATVNYIGNYFDGTNITTGIMLIQTGTGAGSIRLVQSNVFVDCDFNRCINLGNDGVAEEYQNFQVTVDANSFSLPDTGKDAIRNSLDNTVISNNTINGGRITNGTGSHIPASLGFTQNRLNGTNIVDNSTAGQVTCTGNEFNSTTGSFNSTCTNAVGVAFGVASGTTLFDAEPITSALTTDPHGSFVAGAVIGKEATNPTVDLTEDSTTNFIALIKIDPDVVVGDQFCFQPRIVGGVNFTHDVTPCLTVANPSFGGD